MLDSAIHQKNHFPADKTFGDQYLFFNANCCYASISQGKLLHVCLAVRNVLPGGTSVPQWQKFHTYDVKSVLIWSGALIGQRCIMWTLIYNNFSWQGTDVPPGEKSLAGGEEWEEADVFTG